MVNAMMGPRLKAANDNQPRRDRRKGRAVSLEERLLAELMYAG